MSTHATPGHPGTTRPTDLTPLALGLILVVLGTATFITESRIVRVTLSVAVVFIVLITLRATSHPHRHAGSAFVGGVLLAALVVAGGTWEVTAVNVAAMLLIAGALGYAAVSLVQVLFGRTTVGARDVIAALTAYLQVALMFAFLYGATELATGELFPGSTGGSDLGELVYFSVVTITTLGFGDLVPITDLGRSLVMIETISGQIILVVLIAYLVGKLGADTPTNGGA